MLKHAPHTAAAVTADTWTHPYSREQAAFPLPCVRASKFWPSVGRIDNPYGDRNLVCVVPAAGGLRGPRPTPDLRRRSAGDCLRVLNAAQMREADRQTIDDIGISVASS